MKKNFWKIAACSAWMTILGMLIVPVLVFADPIVVGVPHEEFVAYCPTLEAAKTFALTEEQSIAAGETTTQYNKKGKPRLREREMPTAIPGFFFSSGWKKQTIPTDRTNL